MTLLEKAKHEKWQNTRRSLAMRQNGGRALAPSVERFLAPALSFVTFLFAVEKKSKLAPYTSEVDIIRTPTRGRW